MKQVAKSTKDLYLSVCVTCLLFLVASLHAEKFSKTYSARTLKITAEVNSTEITTGDLLELAVTVDYPQETIVDFSTKLSQKDVVLQGSRQTDAKLLDNGMFSRTLHVAYEPQLPTSLKLKPIKLRVKIGNTASVEQIEFPLITINSLLPKDGNYKPFDLEPRTMSKFKAIVFGIALSLVIIALTVWFTYIKRPKEAAAIRSDILKRLDRISDANGLRTTFCSWAEEEFSIELSSVPFTKYTEAMSDSIGEEMQEQLSVVAEKLELIQYSGKAQDLELLKQAMLTFITAVQAAKEKGEDDDI